jgi:glycosyltransferase involved in cell wall biosynthesis
MIEAFAILKERYHIPHTLVLAGKPGYGYSNIKNQKSKIKNRDEVIELGYVTEEEKWALLENADAFLFPSLYEGFGIPILEAQSMEAPVVTSRVASLPEVAGEGAAYCDPYDPESIAAATWKVLSNAPFRGDIMKKAAHNVNRFGWAYCAREISRHLR